MICIIEFWYELGLFYDGEEVRDCKKINEKLNFIYLKFKLWLILEISFRRKLFITNCLKVLSEEYFGI